MTKQLRFYKEKTGKWYVDLPGFKGSKAEREMVAGADTMLDIYADGNTEITMNISLSKKPGFDLLKLTREGTNENESGAYYKVTQLNGVDYSFPVWLCDVTKYVFGKFPEQIYLKA